MAAWNDLRAVVFDLDDTLIDWQATEAHAMRAVTDAHYAPVGLDPAHVSDAYGLVKEENFASFRATGRWWFIGDRLRRLHERLEVDPDLDATVATFTGAVRDHLALLPGAADVLRAARGHGRTALLTNGPAHVQRPKVDRLGLAAMVDEVCIAGEMDLWKPDPRAFREALRRIGADPATTLMVGDSLEFDIRPARALGMRTAWVTDPATADAGEADHVVPHVAGLLDALPS